MKDRFLVMCDEEPATMWWLDSPADDVYRFNTLDEAREHIIRYVSRTGRGGIEEMELEDETIESIRSAPTGEIGDIDGNWFEIIDLLPFQTVISLIGMVETAVSDLKVETNQIQISIPEYIRQTYIDAVNFWLPSTC